MDYKFCLLNISWLMDSNVQPCMAFEEWKKEEVEFCLCIVWERPLETAPDGRLHWRLLRPVWGFCFQILLFFFFNFLTGSRGMWVICSPSRDWTSGLAMEAQSLNHWPAREAPCVRGFWKLAVQFVNCILCSLNLYNSLHRHKIFCMCSLLRLC